MNQGQPGGARPAGSDTREAMATPTVRAAVMAALLGAGLGWGAALGAPAALRHWLGVPLGLVPWMALALAASGTAAAILAWRRPLPDDVGSNLGARRVLGVPAVREAALVFALGVAVAAVGSSQAASVLMVALPVLAGRIVGTCARLATSACTPIVQPAAAGVVTAFALLGSAVSGHLALVARGSGLPRAAGWTAVYAALCGISSLRAVRALAADHRRVRMAATGGAGLGGPAPAVSLVLDRITVSFDARPVLRDAVLPVDPGELIALVGGNGAGKSTLLRVAAGLVTPDAGRVLVGGEDVSALHPEERAAAGLAFVSGARPIFPDLTVHENLRVAAYRTHVTPRSFAAATEAIFEMVPMLAGRTRSRAGVLSGGEQRILAVAQTLYRMPTALLADELTLGLDLDSRLAVLDLLRHLAQEGVGVVAVDHDLPSLLPRADAAALLSGGELRIFRPAGRVLAQRGDLLPATFLAGANL